MVICEVNQQMAVFSLSLSNKSIFFKMRKAETSGQSPHPHHRSRTSPMYTLGYSLGSLDKTLPASPGPPGSQRPLGPAPLGLTSSALEEQQKGKQWGGTMTWEASGGPCMSPQMNHGVESSHSSRQLQEAAPPRRPRPLCSVHSLAWH